MAIRIPLLLAAAIMSVAAAAEVPTRIDDPAGGPPIWITAEAAKNDHGSLRSELFEPWQQQDIARTLEKNRELRRSRDSGPDTDKDLDGCQTYTISASGLSLPDTRIETLVDYATVAVVARVRGEKTGFVRGWPTRLIEADVERVLKKPQEMTEFSTFFFSFSDASIEIDGEMLCWRNQHYPHRPTVGKRVLVFAETVTHRQPLVLLPHSSAILFEREDGSLVIPWVRDGFVGAAPDWSLIEKQLEHVFPMAKPSAAADQVEN